MIYYLIEILQKKNKIVKYYQKKVKMKAIHYKLKMKNIKNCLNLIKDKKTKYQN